MEQQLKRNDFFLTTVYRKYMLASVLSMLATSVAGIIDTVLVGWFLGEEGLSAMSLVSPVYLIYYTIGAVIGMGGSIAANLRAGKNDYEGYRRLFSLSFWMTIAACLLTTAGGLLLLEPMVAFFGGEGLIGEYTREYLFWYILGGAGTLLIYIPLNFLKMEGLPQISSALFMLSSGLNVVFTWLFMSPVFDMGIKGASIGTALAMTATALWGLYILLKKGTNTSFVRVKPTWEMLGEILLCGSPNGLNNLLNSLKILVINSWILRIGAAAYLPVFSMVRNVSDLLCGVMIGVASALMPVVGVFFGERDNESIRRVCKKALQIGGALSLIPAVFVAAFPGLVSSLFNLTDQAARSGAETALLCLAISCLFAFFNLMLTGYFNTVGRPMLSNLILVLRLLAYLAPSVMLLGSLTGIEGIWLALILAEALTFGTALLVMGLIRKKNPSLDRLLLDTTGEKEKEISFSVGNTTEDIMFASEKITEFCQEAELDMKKTMQISLALEEMLTVIIGRCMDPGKEQFVDIRIKKFEEDVLMRIRNTGNIFDPIRYYEENKEDPEQMEQLLGIKMILGTAKDIEFRETFGTNNLLIRL